LHTISICPVAHGGQVPRLYYTTTPAGSQWGNPKKGIAGAMAFRLCLCSAARTHSVSVIYQPKVYTKTDNTDRPGTGAGAILVAQAVFFSKKQFFFGKALDKQGVNRV